MSRIPSADCTHIVVELSGNPKAKMCWTVREFRRKIFGRYGLTLVGWPYDKFVNLSEITGLMKIKWLTSLWDSGAMRLERLSDVVAQSRCTDSPAPPTILDMKDTPRQQRKDIKSRHPRPKTNPLNLPYRYERNGPKSARWVSDEAEAEAGAEMGAGMELEDDPIEQYDDVPSRTPVQRYEFFPRACRDHVGVCRGIELRDDKIEEFVD